MQPVSFAKQNVVFAKDQPEYLPLPAYRGPKPEHVVISCWQLSWRERIKAVLTGRIWVQQWTFGGPLQPQRVDIDEPIEITDAPATGMMGVSA